VSRSRRRRLRRALGAGSKEWHCDAEIPCGKNKMKQAVIPKFSSEAEEPAWWDAHRSEIEAEIRQRMKQKRPLTLGSLLQGAKPSRRMEG
jgi:hypothetical protein